MVVITDAHYVQAVLGNKENLNKGMEPDNSDRLLSVHGHRTLFSSDTNSKYWRMVRKGTSGAFQHKNIRYPIGPSPPLISEGPKQAPVLSLLHDHLLVKIALGLKTSHFLNCRAKLHS